MGRHQGPAGVGAAHAQQHHRHVGRQGVTQDRPQVGSVPDRLEHQREHPGLGQPQRVPGVGRGGGDELLPGRDGQAEAEAAACPQHRGEHRTRVGDQGDRPRGQVRLDVADGPQAPGHVHEPHTAGPAHRHPGRRGRRGQPVPQPRQARRGVKGAAEDDGRTVAPAGGRPQLRLQCGIGDGQQHQVHRFRDVGEGRQAARAADVGVPRVDQVGARPGRAPGHFGDHPGAEAARPGAGPDQRDAACFQHRADGLSRCGHERRGRRTAARRSEMAALAACRPGMPQTPPPPWVAELA